MTVKELLTNLQNYPQEMKVAIYLSKSMLECGNKFDTLLSVDTVTTEKAVNIGEECYIMVPNGDEEVLAFTANL